MQNTQKFNLGKFNIVKKGISSGATSVTKTESNCYPSLIYKTRINADSTTKAETKQPETILLAEKTKSETETEAEAKFINRVAIRPKESQTITAASAKTAEIYGIETINLPDLILKPGQELIIDTGEMTVTLDKENAIHLLSDDSTFFLLAQGEDIITYSDEKEERNVNIKIMHKNRWL